MKFMTHVSRDYLIGFALVLLMVAGAMFLHDQEIILPEIAALTAGMWIYHNPRWLHQPYKIFLAPSGTAVIGFLINQLPVNYPIKISLTLVGILVLLRELRSPLAPAFATGLLPIIVNATHWSFIGAIFLFTLILMIGVLRQGHYRHAIASDPIHFQHILSFAAVATVWIIGVCLAGQPQMAGIPPVLVVFFEVLQRPTYSGKLALKQIAALSGAATIGVVGHLLVTSWLLATLISLPLVLLLLALLNLKLPAAYAFPLLALVLPPTMFIHLPIAATLAASFFLGTVLVYRKITAAMTTSITEEN